MPDSDKLAYALAVLQHAREIYLAGDTRQALHLLTEALSEGPSDPSLFALILTQKAEWARESGRLELAEASLRAAAHFVEKMPVAGHETEWSMLRGTQGFLAQADGDYPAAERFFEQAADLSEGHPLGEFDRSDIYANQAGVYLMLGKLGKAQQVTLKALELDQRLGNARGESNDLNVLGLISQQRGDDETARAYFAKAAAIAKRNGLNREAMAALDNLRGTLDQPADQALAAELGRESEALRADSADSARLACDLAGLGVQAVRSGDYERAVGFLVRSQELHLASGNAVHAVGDLINLAAAETRLGRYDEALDHAEQALRGAREFGVTDQLWRAEYHIASSRLARATAREFDRDAPGPEVWEIVAEIGAALDGYRRAINDIELLRSSVDHPDERHAILTGKEEVYTAAIWLCFGRNRVHDALELTERARMRSFLDALGGARVARLEEPDPAAGRRAELARLLLSPETPAADKPTLMNELRMVRAELTARQPAVAAITEAQLPSTAEIVAAIPPLTVMLVYYQLTNSTILIFPMSREDGLQRMYKVELSHPVENMVDDFRREIEQGDGELPTGQVLFSALICPVLEHLQRVWRVIVVPHGALHYVPFSALWCLYGRDAPARRYLTTLCPLTTIPSASYLVLRDKIPGPVPAYGPPVVLGNPTGDLPRAEAEARNTAAVLGVQPLLGTAATRDALLRCGTPSVLHVASHGVYNAVDPLLSRLLLADGGVSVEDLLDAGPAPGLLVLSGCLTGQSGRGPGDELIGLAQAILRRGTRAVVATLWETFDDSSELFFGHFYESLRKSVPVNAALTLAREHLMQAVGGFDHPVDWAPFVLIGDQDFRVPGNAVDLRALGWWWRSGEVALPTADRLSSVFMWTPADPDEPTSGLYRLMPPQRSELREALDALWPGGASRRSWTIPFPMPPM